MNNNSLTAWFFEGGAVAVPKRLIGLTEILGISHKELGEITYVLYCDNKISKNDKFSLNAVKSLKSKGLIKAEEVGEEFLISFDPLFSLIEKQLGLGDASEKENFEKASGSDLTYSEMLKIVESRLGIFLSVRDKMEIQEMVQQYLWDYDLISEMYISYRKNFKRLYPFKFFCKMAYGNNVNNLESFQIFAEKINYLDYKIVEVKKRLGHRKNYSEVEKETYLKWINMWKFDHEMILLAVEQTISAKDPTFKYLDKILENWHNDGVKTREDFTRKEKEYLKEKEISKEKSNKSSVGVGKITEEQRKKLNRFIE